ncbi:MAG TPA: cob(I)yrinic acid a,c-diamide adenosyltransferase [candidate division Zixibacteria bacterium]|nr:cob(I)yrinic acid a,c-diamide adenosyltransferase [candidate division Zixibacteria bacterium]
MPKLTKIYTRTGDLRTTALGTKTRVSKDSLRVKTYGDIDELNSMLGVAIASGLDSRLVETIIAIQNELFVLGSDLAFPQDAGEGAEVPRIEDRHIEKLEALIDEIVEMVGSLKNFILPGGSIAASHLHVARAICRRAERSLVELALTEAINELSLRYLNRLSDALFVLARCENYYRGIKEPLWDSRK